MSAKVLKIELRDPRKLKPHPENAEIYSKFSDDEFAASVKRLGVKDPVSILSNGTIVGGHRRTEAAIKAKLDYIPCIVRGDVDPKDQDEVLELLIALNNSRPKTNEDKAREFSKLSAIEACRAKERMGHGKGDGPSGQAGDIAAKKVGLSRPTAVNAVKVVKRIDELENNGDIEAANKLREKLNKNVKGALREIEPEAPKTKYDEMIPACDWVLNHVVPRIQEHALLMERGLGVENFQAGRVQQVAKTLHVLFTNGKRISEHARNQLRSKGA